MTAMMSALRALRIDPEAGTVVELDVEPHEIRGLVGGGRVDTVELDATHCLVINTGELSGESRTCFRLAGTNRPFFGPALVLGLVHGNWVSASLEADHMAARITWQEWDAEQESYVVPSGQAR